MCIFALCIYIYIYTYIHTYIYIYIYIHKYIYIYIYICSSSSRAVVRYFVQPVDYHRYNCDHMCLVSLAIDT